MYASGPTPINIHYQEDLECEDKWVAWYLYNKLGPPGAPPRPLLDEPEVIESSAQPLSVVRETALFQNYPDPFNPETWIPYQLAEDADVSIELYDTQAQLVRTLKLGQKSKGRYIERHHAAYWDGKNEKGELLPSGVYFYTLKAGNFSHTLKMLLVK